MNHTTYKQVTAESNHKSCLPGHIDGVDRSFEQSTTTKKVRNLGAVHKQRWPLVGGGIKNWSKLPTDSTKKLLLLGRGCQKSGEIADIVYGWPLMLIITANLPQI